MSSTYDVLCLGHDPAIRALEGLPDFTADRGTFEAVLKEVREDHPGCELAITRCSGAVIAVGCVDPGSFGGHGHSSPMWIDMDVLRIIYQARLLTQADATDTDGLRQALVRAWSPMKCWPAARIERLRNVVELEPWGRGSNS